MWYKGMVFAPLLALFNKPCGCKAHEIVKVQPLKLHLLICLLAQPSRQSTSNEHQGCHSTRCGVLYGEQYGIDGMPRLQRWQQLSIQ